MPVKWKHPVILIDLTNKTNGLATAQIYAKLASMMNRPTAIFHWCLMTLIYSILCWPGQWGKRDHQSFQRRRLKNLSYSLLLVQ
ncbi:MAG: hypothetical protein WCG27_03365 [Pseudomonadota bacterium]